MKANPLADAAEKFTALLTRAVYTADIIVAWRRFAPAIQKLPQRRQDAARKSALRTWSILDGCDEGLAGDRFDAMLEHLGPDGDPPPSRPAVRPPPPAKPVECDAIAQEPSLRGTPAQRELLEELRAKLASKTLPYGVGASYAARYRELGPLRAQGRADTIDRLLALPGIDGDERLAHATLDGTVEDWEERNAAKVVLLSKVTRNGQPVRELKRAG